MKKSFFTRVGILAFSVGLPALLMFSAQVWAHGGEDHSDGETVTLTTQGNFSISGAGETYELTVAYEAFEKGENVALRLFVANLETNRPVSDAELNLTLTGPDVDMEITPTPVESSPGEYETQVSVPKDADYSFLVEISTRDEFDLFSVDGFSPPPPEVQEEEVTPTFSLMSYATYIMLGGYVLVALIAYTLGTRERTSRRNTPDKTPIKEQ